jgi:hypothetical protein
LDHRPELPTQGGVSDVVSGLLLCFGQSARQRFVQKLGDKRRSLLFVSFDLVVIRVLILERLLFNLIKAASFGRDICNLALFVERIS